MLSLKLTPWIARLHLLRLAAPIRLRFGPAITQPGWVRSFVEQKPVDMAGDPIPFMSYPALDLLKSRMPADVKVFEFGAGYSTLWWAKRAKQVVSCEHDSKWRALVQQMAPPNVQVLHRSADEDGIYPKSITEDASRYDVIVIDGRQRVACSRACLPHLGERGIIIWDDTDRERYRSGLQELREQGFKQLELVGLGPVVADVKCTSIFYRNENVLML